MNLRRTAAAKPIALVNVIRNRAQIIASIGVRNGLWPEYQEEGGHHEHDGGGYADEVDKVKQHGNGQSNGRSA
jgi:hypothetical protein